jgi:hypothetical protein
VQGRFGSKNSYPALDRGVVGEPFRIAEQPFRIARALLKLKAIVMLAFLYTSIKSSVAATSMRLAIKVVLIFVLNN